MKLTVIGGGGVRSMFLAKSIAQKADALKIDELVFMDNNPEKLNIYGKMAEMEVVYNVKYRFKNNDNKTNEELKELFNKKLLNIILKLENQELGLNN